MTQFEQMLLQKGYLKYILNGLTMKFEIAEAHHVSTMVNLDHRYFHHTDENILRKIASGKSVLEKDFTWHDRKGEICFGLHEAEKPPTLISPRPRIKVKRIKNGKHITENEERDDSMNAALLHMPHEQIFEAMYDKSIVLEIDLT